ncbi:Crp/Fnr family transcriptional regulator [Bacteroidota bacterium]
MVARFNYPSCAECNIRYKTYFNILSEEDVEDLNREKTCTFYKKDQDIFIEGTGSTSGLYCLYSGRIKLFKNDCDGKEHIVRLIAPGQLFGVKALLEGINFSATANAIEDSVVCFINKKRIFYWIKKYPNLANNMLMSLSRMLDEAEKRMTSVALKSVRERVAESLIILVNTYNTGDDLMNVQISRFNLSSCVGSATENVIRILSDFKDEKLISVNRKTITILNMQGLLKVANII